MSHASRSRWIITLSISVGAVLYVWFVFRPGQAAIKEVRLEIESKRSQAINRMQYERQAQKAQQKLATSREFVSERNAKLVTAADVPRLYAEIAAAATRAGVETTRFAPDPLVTSAQLVRCPIHIGCEGSFAQIGALIQGLEKLPYNIWFENVTLDADEEKREKLRCEISLEVFAKISGFSG